MLVRACLRRPLRSALAVLLAAALAGCAPSRGPGLVPVSLDPPAAPGSVCPVAASNGAGAAWLAWIEPVDTTRHRLVVSRLADLRWSAPVVIAEGESLFVNPADTPALAAVGGDTLVACWPWRMAGGEWALELRVSRSTDGGASWSAPVVGHRDRSPVEHGFASVARTPSGVRIAWLDARAGLDPAGAPLPEGTFPMALAAATLRADGTLEPETLLDTRTCDCCPTAQVAVPGGALLAYRDRDTTEIRDIALLRTGDDGVTAPVPLARDGWHLQGCPVNGPALAARGDHVAVAWFSAAGDTARLWLARSRDAGARFETPRRVDAGRPFGRAAVALLPAGDAVAGWIEQRPAGARFLVRRVPHAGHERAADTLATFPSPRGVGIPRLAPVGMVVLAAWTDPEGTGRVRASLLTPR